LRRLLGHDDRDDVVDGACPVVGEDVRGGHAVAIERLRRGGARERRGGEDRDADRAFHRSAPSLRYGTRTTPPPSTHPSTSRFDATFTTRTASPRRAS